MGSFGLWLTRGAQTAPTLKAGTDETNKPERGPNPRVGVGLVMAVEESGSTYISDLAANSAAWHSSLCIGDRITHIDGVPLKSKSASAVNDLLLGMEGTMVELRIEAKVSADANVSSLCKPARRIQQKAVHLMRGRAALQNLIKMEGTIQVQAMDASQCSGKLVFGLLCMPTEHVIYSFLLSLHGHKWDLHKRYSDFVQIDRRLRAAYSDAKLDHLLGASVLPGKAYLDKSSASLIEKRKQRLELYLRALVAHRAMAKSDMLRNFLQLPDELYSAPLIDDFPPPRRPSAHADGDSGGDDASVASLGSEEETYHPSPAAAAAAGAAAAARGGAAGGGWDREDDNRGIGGGGGEAERRGGDGGEGCGAEPR